MAREKFCKAVMDEMGVVDTMDGSDETGRGVVALGLGRARRARRTLGTAESVGDVALFAARRGASSAVESGSGP